MKTKLILTSLVLGLTTMFSSASAEEISWFKFQDGWNVWLKIEDMSEGGTNQYFISVALRAKEWEQINQMEWTLNLDPEVFNLTGLENSLDSNFIKWDIFTESEIDWDQLKDWIISFTWTTDTWFIDKDPTDAFWLLVEVNSKNKKKISEISINSDSFILTDNKNDPNKNLFSWKLTLDVNNLPVEEAIEEPVKEVVEKPVEKPVEIDETPIIEEKPAKINTGLKENIMFLFLAWLVWMLYLYNRREENV